MRFLLFLGLVSSALFAKPIVVALQDRVVDATVIVAFEKKFFQEEGIEVIPKRFTSGPATSEALIFGDADIATMGDTAALIAISKYCPSIKMLIPLGGGEKRHGVVIPLDSNATTLKDLVGKKIAVKKGTSTNGGLLLRAKKEGITLEKEMMDLEPSLMASALYSKEVDAVVASEPTPSVLVEKGIGKRMMTLEGLGNSYPLLVMVKEASFKEHREKIPAFLKALEKANAFIRNAPNESAALVSSFSKLSVKATQEAMSYHFYTMGWDEASQESLAKMAQFLVDARILKTLPSIDACIAR